MKNYLNRHIKEIHPSTKDYKCNECESTFKNKTSLRQHVNTVHGKNEKNFKCNHCAYEFHRRPELEKHLNAKHFAIARYKCDFCERAFAHNGSLYSHRVTKHLNKTLFKCELCDKSYTSNGSLTRHIASFHEGKTFHCEICGEQFAYSFNVLDHKRKVHKTCKEITKEEKITM